MKNKHFILIVLCNVFMFFVSFASKALFVDQTVEFDYACMGFFFAIILIFEYKNALKPTKGINMTKKYYEKRCELNKYQNICKFFFLFAFVLGILNFLCGVGVILIDYIKSVWLA